MNTNKKLLASLIATLLFSVTPVTADDERDDDEDDPREARVEIQESEDNDICMGHAPAILQVADFDGNGIVDDRDITIIKRARKHDIYYAFYDIDADGEFDKDDIHRAEADLGKSSSTLDQQKAVLFHQVKQIQIIDSEPELRATRYLMAAPSLAGHGEHWTYGLPGNPENIFRPEGINFSKEESSAKGIFWSQDAVPVFANGATDYPQPNGEWMSSRVISFAGGPPKYTESDDEVWHTHAGLCLTAHQGENGIEPLLHQHTSFAECQAMPTLFKTEGTHNAWFNIWMLHGWMFDLNPRGFFAGTHPCVDSNSVSESTINEGREVPPFFQHH